MSQPPTEPGSGKPAPSGKGGGAGGGHVFQAPTGTRDMYPADLARLRYVQDAWRRTSINHGFEEIDGPTFEHLDLYTVKSGEGIVSELFSFERFGGEKSFALRPEFTPTLARMYASKAASLPKPTKWFWMQNCFRAERPQRGRLREFWQWNCDIIGDDSAAADAECIACCVGAMEALGLTHRDVTVKISNRNVIAVAVLSCGVDASRSNDMLALLDKRERLSAADFQKGAADCGLKLDEFDKWLGDHQRAADLAVAALVSGDRAQFDSIAASLANQTFAHTIQLLSLLQDANVLQWCRVDLGIVRGLAYYTGTVFEVIASGERAVAGGGRYDRLVELLNGPSTPAVGFGMGDVVLSLVLADKGLMPKDDEIASRLGLNPDAVVVSNGTPEADGVVAKVVADLRRAGLHARRSSKKIGKAMQDAAKVRARYCVILESATQATVKDMGTQEQAGCGVEGLVERLKRR